MDIVVERCAGLDVHKDSVVACVRSPGGGRPREETIVTFGTTTVQLLALRDWLVAMGVSLVGMESTGVYWKPVYYMLEDAIECWPLNAQHLRNVPGRKTDVADAAWICQLIEHGLSPTTTSAPTGSTASAPTSTPAASPVRSKPSVSPSPSKTSPNPRRATAPLRRVSHQDITLHPQLG